MEPESTPEPEPENVGGYLTEEEKFTYVLTGIHRETQATALYAKSCYEKLDVIALYALIGTAALVCLYLYIVVATETGG